MMIKVKIPATSANMGAGFDCLGIALGLYNYVYAEETDGGLNIEIRDKSADYLPTDERNLVYRSMQAVFDRVGYRAQGLHIILENNIPVTRGLGSSSAGIVGGLLAANELCGAGLSADELLDMAAKIEGHPDNVAPAILGGITINASSRGKIRHVKAEVPKDLKFAAFVPNFPLPTKKSREILPRSVALHDAAFNTGRCALLLTSIMTGHYENIRIGVEDRLHQRFRKRLIPHIDDLFRQAYRSGALGVYLSGAGPTVVAIIKGGDRSFEPRMRGYLRRYMNNWRLHILNADNVGAAACKIQMEVN
ncbi:MAG: homoserine kinase [Clostridia bacterium]|nr:homoserine kinase [Clostridia bacterium]